MKALGASDLLRIWEQAAAQPPGRRSYVLLLGMFGDPQAAAALTIGQRDRRLMLVHRDLFGDRIEGLTMCPQCQGPVEVRFDVTDFAQQSEAIVEPALVVVQDYEVHWRLPTCGDLAELADETSPERMRQRMLERCLLEIRRRDERIASAECPPAVIDNVCTAMAQADPWGDIRLEVTCPECGTKWKSAFDIGAFLWRELDAWARRLLREIHCLASAFGWSERDILALSARRRAMYLEMVGA